MNPIDILIVIRLLIPEIALAAFTFVTLMLGLLLRGQSVEKRHAFIGRFVMADLAVVFLFYLFQLVDPISLSFQPDPGRFVIGNGAFVVSNLNTLFKMLVIVLAFVTILIGIQTPFSGHVGEYYGMILFSVLGMLFLISSEDLLMIFISLEFISLSLYVLTAFQKGARRSAEAGLKYFLFGGLSAAFLLFGLSYIFGVTGQTGLRGIAEVLGRNGHGNAPSVMLNLGILFTLAGIGFKIAAVPFHLWAPDAYEGAPVPVAALIATGSKVASFVVLTKLLLWALIGAAGNALSWPAGWHSGWTIMVIMIAVLSMGLGNLAAIAQKNVKRLLAYSSVAHAGYILVAMVAINARGEPSSISISAIYFYILVYALTNIGAFGVLNVLASKVGGDDFGHFTGIARRAPFLSLLMLVFLLSLAGIPPLAGFFGKFYLFAAAVQADPKNLGLLWLVAFAIGMSAVSLYYYLKLAKQMYVLPAMSQQRLPSGPVLCGTLGTVGLAVLLLGIFPDRVIGIIDGLHKPLGPKASVMRIEHSDSRIAKPLFQSRSQPSNKNKSGNLELMSRNFLLHS